MMFLPLLLRNWQLIAIALLSLSLWGAITYARHERDLANIATEIANTNAAIAEQERADRIRADSIIAEYEAKKKVKRQTTNQKLAEVAHATNEMDGPLAPVLRSTLDGLPEPPAKTGKNDS